MEKIVLFTFVFLAAVVMINALANDSTTTAPTTAPGNETGTLPGSNDTTTTTAAASTAAGDHTTPAAAAAIQPLAVFVLACAFLGLMH